MTFTRQYATKQLGLILDDLQRLEDQTDYEIKEISEAINLLQKVNIDAWKLSNSI